MTDNPNPGSSEGEAASDETGQTVQDAAEASYDAWDTQEHGISESDRTSWGPELQKVAGQEGTTVKTGVDRLVSAHIAKRYGSPEAKRQALGEEIDFYQINPMPTAAPQADGVSNLGTGQVIETEAQAEPIIQEFMQANPIAQDGEIQERMIAVAKDMRTQGYQPRLDVMLQHAVQNDPRYSEAARQAQEADQVARAKAASVQVSGAGSTAPSGTTNDIDGILDEMIPS